MTWQNQLNDSAVSWLLSSDTLGVRYLALRDLLDLPASDKELAAARSEAHQAGPIAAVLAGMDPEGFWVEPGPGYNPKYRSSVWAIILLAQLGARVEQDRRIAHACSYLLDHALAEGGQLSVSGAPSGTADCLQGNLLWAMLELGYEDPRLETAFEWMARSVTGEGIAANDDRHAAVRYYAGKCGPTFACGANNKLPCAWGGAKVMLALGNYPHKMRTPLMERAIQQGVDFFFSVDPASAGYPGGYSAKPSQNWWKFGFPVFYVTDILQIVEALGVLGYGKDPRLVQALALIRQKQDASGVWNLEYDYAGKTWGEFGEKKQPNPWVTLRALRALRRCFK